MMQFLRRLTARLQSRGATLSSQRPARRTVLRVEALEDRLAPSMNNLVPAVQSMGDPWAGGLAGQERQIDYWSWGEHQIPVEQFFGSTR